MRFQNSAKTGQLLAKNARPQNVLYAGLLSGIAAWSSGASGATMLYCYLTMVALYALATSLNNLQDAPTDRLNHRHDNPFAYGHLTARQLWLFVGACVGVLGLLQLGLQQPGSMLCIVGYIALSVSYSHPRIALQARGLIATALLTLCYGAIPFLLGALQNGNLSDRELTVTLLQIPLLVPLLLAKDYKDVLGDALTGKRTPLVRYGSKAVLRLSVGIAISTIAIYALAAAHFRSFRPISVALGGIYLLFVYRLHVTKGAVPKIERLALTVTLLAIALTRM